MSERTAVQNPMLRYAQEIGWEYVTPEEALALRGGEAGLFFSGVLEQQLFRLNPGVVDEAKAADIIRRLQLLPPNIEGNREALSWLKGEHSVFVPEENRERNVRLIDFYRPDENLFQVTDEWRQKSAVYRNKADVVFLINGVPVALCETKAATKPDGLAIGVDQIRRYHRETPEMFIATQVFEVTQLLDFFYGPTWCTSRKNLFNWRNEVPSDYEAKVKAFFHRPLFLQLLKDYIVFLTKDDELIKVILRQHQTRAVEKVITRVHEPHKRRGLIWHTQGSGKTLTMMTIAAKLLQGTIHGEKPTVLMLVDRNELEAQLFKNLASYGFANVQVAGSKRELRQILASDFRGLIVSMIHKFDDIPADINTRRNVIVLVDEAHRTTGGDLGNYLMAALPNATYIGFTGTPIDRLSRGQGTFKVFGVDDETGYLDKYSIAEPIEDGTTVKLNYALAPSDLRVDRETLEKEFLSLTAAEGLSDPEELNAILDRAVKLKEIMKSPNRMERIASFVAEHFRENVEPMGFKGFLVAVDREACALYKKLLDKYLPEDYSRPVYSPAQTNGALLKEFYLSEDEEKKIRREFIKKDALPKILIVTEKLLTGYDAPILYCMYLDKPMRDHVLLQAIARVNRPYEDEDGLVKPCGFVLDFVGIFEDLEKALAFDSEVVASVIQNIDVLKQLLISAINRLTLNQTYAINRAWKKLMPGRYLHLPKNIFA
ncbi:MAG: HsdR family type I site-specific deoxyribonuclease, partial [Deltaproteobacteria bacterium]|nr:HsdR family type I site-specific deoxyribonuclease [Deltaproteobacteria bacterium]